METLVQGYNGYILSEPTSNFGWTFFKLALKPNLQNGIEEKFADMINSYRLSKQPEQFAKFLGDYFNAKGCTVNVKVLNI